MSMSADGELQYEPACRGRDEIWILRFHFQIHKQERIKFLEENVNVT